MPRKKKPLVEDVKNTFTTDKQIKVTEFVPPTSYHKGSIRKDRTPFHSIKESKMNLMAEHDNIFEALAGADITALRIMSYVIQKLNKNSSIIELKPFALEKSLGINYKRTTIAILDLIDRNVIAPVSEQKAMYFVNPHYILKGNPMLVPEITINIVEVIDLNSNAQKAEDKRYDNGESEPINDDDITALSES